MKKVALIILICNYTLATMGFSLHQFYCCGRLKSISVTILKDTQQKFGKDNDAGGCCQNKFQFFKVKDNHITAGKISSPAVNSIGLHSFTSWFQNIIFTTDKVLIANGSNAPPLYRNTPLYISNCVFRI